MAETIIQETDDYRIVRRTSAAGYADTVEWKPGTAGANEQAIRDAVVAHFADLRAIRNTSGTLNGANLSNAVRVLARGQIHVLRLLLGALDGTD